MNDEKSGEVEIRRENALSDSSNTAVDGDGSEDVKPPDSKRFQLETDEMVRKIRETEAKIKSLEKQVSGFGGKIKAAMSIDKEKLKSELQELRTRREKVIEERKQFDHELKGLNMQVQKKNDACTKLQAGVRYKSEARIDEAVRRLEHQMQAQQLKLSEEKRIVAEIDTLKRSKRNLKEYLDLKQYVDQLRNRQRQLRSQRDACVKRINVLKSREEEVKNLLDSDVSDENEETKHQQLELLNEIELLKTELDELHTKKRDLKANFTKERNDYYAAIRETRTHKQKEESTRRKNERLVTLSKPVVSSRTKEQPHEKEKALCDTLINHLERLHIHLPDVQAASPPEEKEPVISLAASADFSLSGDKGMFLRRKSATDDLIGVYAGVARTSRRGSRKGRRSSAKEVPRKLNLHPEVVEHLLTLGLSPPSTAADIPKVLEELQEKKDFYESALTSSHVLAPVSNDAMSPITEEAAPEFPSTFEESNKSETPEAAVQFPSTFEESSNSETPEEAIQDETTTSVEDNRADVNMQNRADANMQDNSPVTPEGISLNSTEAEEASLSENTDKANAELTENLNGFLSEKAELKMVELKDTVSSESSALCNPKPAVFSGNCEASLGEATSHSPAHTANEPNSEVLCAVNDDLHGSDDMLSNCVENEKCNHVREDKLEYPVNNQMHSAKTGTSPKEGNLVPHLQSNTICTEHSSFTSSSTRSTNLLMEENGLEVAYDRNSLNESGGIVKIQCEKCPA